MKQYFIADEDESIYYYITDKSDKLKTIKSQEVKQLGKSNPENDYWYECYDMYDDEMSIHDKLINFKKDFNDMNNEIKELYDESNYNHLDCTKYKSNRFYVTGVFKKYATKKLKELNIDDINEIEGVYIEKTPNGGLTYLDKTGYIENCYGSDFSGYYMSILGNKKLGFKIPIKQGQLKHYDSVEDLRALYKAKKLKYGFYDIKITSEHKDVTKFFKFSETHCYTHISLLFAFRYKQLYGFKFEKIEKEFNSYVYDDKSLINCSEIFEQWYEQLKIFKEKLPKNKIIKHISSSLWGYLIQFNRKYVGLDELMEMEDIDDYKIEKHSNDKSISLIKKNKMYREALARIKSFLTAFARDYMSRLLIDNKLHDNIIRIQCDGVVLNKPHTFKGDYVPIPETKTSGSIFWVNVNKYYHKCDKCENFYKFNKLGCPECCK
jgi:hypothetical protein